MKALGLGIVFSALGSFSLPDFNILRTASGRCCPEIYSAENFGICFFALTMVAILSSGNMIRGLLAGLFGLMFTLVGMAPIDGTTAIHLRFTQPDGRL